MPEINQIVTQETTATEKRTLIQYGEGEVPSQVIVNYADLSAGEKTTYDAFIALCQSKIQ